MVSFESDYNNGCLPEILAALAHTNNERSVGYGLDAYSAGARQKIKEAALLPEADVFFLVGGTQANATVIDALTASYQGVLTAPTGHIAVHEAGAVEAAGHKVIEVPTADGRLLAGHVEAYMQKFLADATHRHMACPGMVYIALPTELGQLYRRTELVALYDVCLRYGLRLFIDGARLGYGLVSPQCDVDMPFLARHCHAYTIGGTKVGALFGEAVVFSGMPAPQGFFTIVKRHGALLAKGRLLGVQFGTLFTDGLYFRASEHALRMAAMLKDIFARHGIGEAFPSPTNQLFYVLTRHQAERLSRSVAFEQWEPLGDDRAVYRFVTSWATTEDELRVLDAAF